jgi:hypothetical protein
MSFRVDVLTNQDPLDRLGCLTAVMVCAKKDMTFRELTGQAFVLPVAGIGAATFGI